MRCSLREPAVIADVVIAEIESLNTHATDAQPSGFMMRSADGGYFASNCAGRIGRGLKPPPQFGQRPRNTVSAQRAQNVHSKLQISASSASGGRSRSQHSQLGRSWSMRPLVDYVMGYDVQNTSSAD
jgi:hypothetical protein